MLICFKNSKGDSKMNPNRYLLIVEAGVSTRFMITDRSSKNGNVLDHGSRQQKCLFRAMLALRMKK
jgi:hypothetical protein